MGKLNLRKNNRYCYELTGNYGFRDEPPEADQAPPGTWGHFSTIAPPWIKIWSRFHPSK